MYFVSARIPERELKSRQDMCARWRKTHSAVTAAWEPFSSINISVFLPLSVKYVGGPVCQLTSPISQTFPSFPSFLLLEQNSRGAGT